MSGPDRVPLRRVPAKLRLKAARWRAGSFARRVRDEFATALVDKWRRSREPQTFARYEHMYSSQHGEDGVLREIFRRIGTRKLPYFVEFGVEDGQETNCGYLARALGWSGLMIEGNPKKFAALQRTYRAYSGVTTLSRFLTRDNIARVFEEAGVPTDFDLLSIDIDGNDYWLWEALAAYRPRVVVIEYNAAFPPPVDWKMPYDDDHRWDGSMKYGASLTALYELGRRMGYSLIGTESNGVNAFFLRDDEVAHSGFAARTPEEAYQLPYYGLFRRMHRYRPVDEPVTRAR